MSLTAGPGRQESRARVLEVLRDADDPQAILAVAEAAGLSASAVRFHLANLQRAGLIRPVRQGRHPGPGRPAVRYAALSPDATDPAAAYRTLAGLLAKGLARTGKPTAPTEAGREWARVKHSPHPFHPEAASPLAVLMPLFQELGFAPAARADGRTVELHRCPFLTLAVEQPDVICGVHRGLAIGALERAGAAGQVRLFPVLDGSGPCIVRLDDGPPPVVDAIPPPCIEEHAS